MKCWENDPDKRPTFTDMKNQLKDMENQHRVRQWRIVFYFFIENVCGGKRKKKNTHQASKTLLIHATSPVTAHRFQT